MSAPLKLSAEQLERLADALQRMTKIRRECDVHIGAYGPVDIAIIGSSTVRVGWDDELKQYVIDDRVGD